MNMNDENIYKDTSFLIEELKKEWDSSGQIENVVVISRDEYVELQEKLQHEILKRNKILDGEVLSFRNSVIALKENYVLLRLVKKIATAKNVMEGKESRRDFLMKLDGDENKVFGKVVDGES